MRSVLRFNAALAGYVADYGANRVKEFDYETGKLVGSVDSSGPVGIAVDPPAPL